jgi:ABC-type multidrug transport system ATPase subunit
LTTLTTQSIGKKYNKRWVLKNLSLELALGDCLAITGANGSGKSTLLQMLSGYLSPTEGTILWKANGINIPVAELFNHIGFSSPYMDLPEEYSLHELLTLYFQHKQKSANISFEKMAEAGWLTDSLHKPVKEFSSGMKQRVKLMLCFYSNAPFIFLDEPVANLDARGCEWFNNLIEAHKAHRIIIICSNNLKEETVFCNKNISVEDFK